VPPNAVSGAVHDATHLPPKQIPDTHVLPAEHAWSLMLRQTPLTSWVPAGQLHVLAVAFHTERVGVEHAHVVEPWSGAVDPATHCVHG